MPKTQLGQQQPQHIHPTNHRNARDGRIAIVIAMKTGHPEESIKQV
jgi:hypothetical protein